MKFLMLQSPKRSTIFYLYIFIFILSCYSVVSQVSGQSEQATRDVCSNKYTCRECIQTQSCGWCSLPDFGEKRCLLATTDSVKICQGKYFYVPKNEYIQLPAKNLSYNSRRAGSIHAASSLSSSVPSSLHHEVVQIMPQNVQLKLRLNEEEKIPFFYQQAEDYPVDLYYLMDLSRSMENDKKILSELGNKLAEKMMNLTSNFRLGFGSFVDKVVFPYVDTSPGKLDKPCGGCAPPYGFRNVMPLSANTASFSQQVHDSSISSSQDESEGGFDAIMQAVVCGKEIGWREKARRLLVFSTDAGFHFAGDGKLGGIIKPNDGKCHLNTSGYYELSSFQDYPSIGQINVKVKQNAINLIFAVTTDQIEKYEKLSKHIEGSSTGLLTSDSSNVVDLVGEQYEKIRSEIEMKDTHSKYLKVSYYSRCLNETEPLKAASKCGGLKVGDKVQFEARVMLLECPQDPKEWNQVFKIYPVGINEPLTVNVTMLCDCPCEHPGETDLYEEKSRKCTGYGTYKCGLCDCNSSHFGHKCECDINTKTHSDGDSVTECRPHNTSLVDCSGRGQCICGQCECDTRPVSEDTYVNFGDDRSPTYKEIISGPFCECDNFSCDRHNGLLCSGPDHGTCVCGICECKNGWTGNACDCFSGTSKCIAPNSYEICSGHGTCECGECKCTEDERGTRYSGHFCEKCPTCPRKCKELKDCIICKQYRQNKKMSEKECAQNCTWFGIETVKIVKLAEGIHENICYEKDEEDCSFEFVYKYNNQGKIVVETQEKPQCPTELFILGIFLIVFVPIVLIGLALLLMWKFLTTIKDQREFAKFEKEQAMARWDCDENPLYVQATSTFQNPTYAGDIQLRKRNTLLE